MTVTLTCIVVIASCITVLSRLAKFVLIYLSRDSSCVVSVQSIDDDYCPPVSVYVCICNEPSSVVLPTLSSLSDLDYAKFSVIVVENNSTPDAGRSEVIRQFCENQPNFRFFNIGHVEGAKAGALNFAMSLEAEEAAKLATTPAPLIAIIDSDTVTSPGFLRENVPLFCDPQLAIVSTPLTNAGDDTPFTRWILLIYKYFFSVFVAGADRFGCAPCLGAMTILRRDAITDAGGWEGVGFLTEDMRISWRLFSLGFTSRFVPKSFGTCGLPNLQNVLKQHRRYAGGNAACLVRGAFCAPRPPLLFWAIPACLFNIHILIFLWVVILAKTMDIAPGTPWLGQMMLSVLLLEFCGDAVLLRVVAHRQGRVDLWWRSLVTFNALLIPTSLASLAAFFGRKPPFEVTCKAVGRPSSRGVSVAEIVVCITAVLAGIVGFASDPYSWTAIVIAILGLVIYVVPNGSPSSAQE